MKTKSLSHCGDAWRKTESLSLSIVSKLRESRVLVICGSETEFQGEDRVDYYLNHGSNLNLLSASSS